MGIPGEATYANYAEAHRAFYRLTVLPLVSRVASAVAWWLSEHLGAEIDLRADPDQVPALAEERDGQWKRIGEALFLTVAEKRAALGLPPLAVGPGTALRDLLALDHDLHMVPLPGRDA